ncbi:MAG: class I SAM-dependent methyltransferase [Verrucomicrobiia bacterium]
MCKWVNEAHPKKLLDVGCGDGRVLFRHLIEMPQEFYGVEGASDLKIAAEKRGLKVSSFDLNGRWPYEDEMFDVVFSSQVIEHLHHTRLFVQEMFRVLKKGGTAIVASENLCSWLNLGAMFLGYTPFSLMQTCGKYLGNPLGLHYQDKHCDSVPIDHPAFSGITGHVRVLTVRQAKELFEWIGLQVEEARSVALLPLPDFLSRTLEKWIKNRGHFLILKARKI